jgi:hypothetical protein
MPTPAKVKEFEASIALCRQFISASSLMLADSQLTGILLEDPLYAPALRLRSQLLAAMNLFPEALAAAVVLTAVLPKDAESWKLRGRLELKVNFGNLALYSFNTAKDLGDDDLNGLLVQARSQL